MKFNLRARLVAEFTGTAFLVAAVIGSGIMGERLAGGNVAIALLANTIATGAALVALILTFGPISGAHLNPSRYSVASDSAGDILARRGCVHRSSMCGRDRGRNHRASDVRSAVVLLLLSFQAWLDAGAKRVRSYLRAFVGYRRMLAL